jgi:hypothetical protein
VPPAVVDRSVALPRLEQRYVAEAPRESASVRALSTGQLKLYYE